MHIAVAYEFCENRKKVCGPPEKKMWRELVGGGSGASRLVASACDDQALVESSARLSVTITSVKALNWLDVT
ncbi:hypothetical protein NL676_028736 [Syzygium grande]|nr:hypothetical protein NL676_028736 [Syzygium grande]